MPPPTMAASEGTAFAQKGQKEKKKSDEKKKDESKEDKSKTDKDFWKDKQCFICNKMVFFVNKIPFFITLSRNICFTTVTHLANRKTATIFAAFKSIFMYYLQKGFQIITVTADIEFAPFGELMYELPRTSFYLPKHWSGFSTMIVDSCPDATICN